MYLIGKKYIFLQQIETSIEYKDFTGMPSLVYLCTSLLVYLH